MLANCLKLQYSTISACFVTNSHALLASALQTARQIELDENAIWFGLLNRFEWIIHSSTWKETRWLAITVFLSTVSYLHMLVTHNVWCTVKLVCCLYRLSCSK